MNTQELRLQQTNKTAKSHGIEEGHSRREEDLKTSRAVTMMCSR